MTESLRLRHGTEHGRLNGPATGARCAMGSDEALLPTGRRTYAMNLPASADQTIRGATPMG
jgi:hypothetical protein